LMLQTEGVFLEFKSDEELRVSARLEHEDILKDSVVSEPVVTFNRHGDYFLVGSNPEPTSPDCDTFKKFMGCPDVEAHNAVRWFISDLPKDSIFVKSVYHSCDSPLCPKCYKYGWAVREAGRIESRLKEASKRFGLVEHLVDSIPDVDYGLSLEDLRKKTVRILKARGIFGGCLIFHAFRYRNSIVARKSGLSIGWFWSPHFHILGFIGGEGYGKCRNCSFNPELVHNWDRCKTCNGFEGLTRKLYEKEGGRSGSGHIVKVLGKRKTVGGTAWYQCNHSSVRRSEGKKNSHVVSWFGVCSYRKLKLINGEDVGIKHKCPICGKDLVRLRYLGVFSEISISRRGEIMSMFDVDGNPLWEIVVSRKFEDG
jgi:ssDNA-binding Zn-finger/Zn-ribbon topoisomerase 1